MEEASKEFRALQKPYDPDQLDMAVQEMLRERQSRRRGNLVDLLKAKQNRKVPK